MKRVFSLALAGLVILFPGSATAGILPGPNTVIESRILWVENQMRLTMGRLQGMFQLKNEGSDFFSTPVLPPIPSLSPSIPETPGGVAGITQSAAEGLGQAMSGLPQVEAQFSAGNSVHDLAYRASPEGALRLGADMEGRMFQTLVNIHQDLLYLLKVQSSQSGLKGSVLDQSHAENIRDQEIMQVDLPQWIMIR